MTYCAAFVARDFIVLTADTVESNSVNAETPMSYSPDKTFFDEPTKFNGFEVSDCALKIFKISEKRLIAAAGEKDAICDAVHFLREHSAQFAFMAPLFESLEKSHNFSLGSVQILCAESVQSSLILGVWSAGRGLSFPANQGDKPANAVLIGTARDGFEFITNNVSKMIANYSVEKLPHVLALINSYHQLVGIHAPTTGKRFGGTYTSAAMTPNGITWQPDTTYFIYSPSELNLETTKLQGFRAIKVLMRHGLLFVETRTPKFRNTLLAPFLKLEEIEAIVKEAGPDLYNSALQMSSDHKVFLSRELPYGVMLHHFHPEYCYKGMFGDDAASVTFSPDFYDLLKAQPHLPVAQGAARLEIVPRGLLTLGYVEPQFP